MIGVDYDLFWTLNPKSLEPFIKAFSMKTDYEDIMAWRQGMYIQRAIASALSKDSPYPKEPMFTSKDLKEEDEVARQRLIKERFMNHMTAINRKFEKE